MTPDPAITRTALVTGGAHRIGRALVDDLAAQGFAVAIHYNRSGDAAKSAATAIRAVGGSAAAVQADLSVESETAALMPKAAAMLGPIGLLVNNASTFEHDDAATADRASWDLHIEPNLRAPFLLSQALAAGLPDDGRGLIVNLLDQRVWRLTQHFMSYTVSKMGLWTLTRTMALGLAPRIRVNAIGPGPTLANARQNQAAFDAQVAATPLMIQPALDDFAAALRFFLSARSVTGQMLALDSGQHLGWSAAQTAATDLE
ncbi:MAG: SDR family oxidoreductase [Pseudomonadota bacterium]